jgi:glutathione S-transferase
MLKLYGGARSRASIVHWYLEELGVPYEFVLLDMAAGEHRKEDFFAINPFGKVPTIVDGDLKLWESGAILLYLAEKYAKVPLSLERKSIFAQWILFANATLGPGLFIQASRPEETPKLLTPLNEIFSKQAFILGEEFSVADIAVGAMLAYVPMMIKDLDLSPYPAVVDYIKRMSAREAFGKSIGNR